MQNKVSHEQQPHERSAVQNSFHILNKKGLNQSVHNFYNSSEGLHNTLFSTLMKIEQKEAVVGFCMS